MSLMQLYSNGRSRHTLPETNAGLVIFLAEAYLKSVDPHFSMTVDMACSLQDVESLGWSQVLKSSRIATMRGLLVMTTMGLASRKQFRGSNNQFHNRNKHILTNNLFVLCPILLRKVANPARYTLH
jgi:hypothetical protein